MLDGVGGAIGEAPVSGRRTGFKEHVEDRAGLRWGREGVARVANEGGKSSDVFGRERELRRARRKNSVK